jgi:hypothetical protein
MTQTELELIVLKTASSCEQNSKDIGELTSTLNRIAEKLDAKTSTRWSHVWSAVGVIAPIIITGVAALSLFWNARHETLKEAVLAIKDTSMQYQHSMNTRTERLENVLDRDLQRRAGLWDNFIYQKLTDGN